MTKSNYRSWVGPEGGYDIVGASQFAVLVAMGMRENHKILDIGCGSLRMGRFCIVHLNKGHYHGLEPEKWALEDGINANLGKEIIEMKEPHFDHNQEFNLQVFNEKFDYIIAQSIFSHAHAQQIKTCLSQASSVLSEEGVFLFNWGKKGNEDYTGTEWVYPGCVHYRTDTIENWIREAGMICRQKRFANLKLKHDWAVCALSENTLMKYDYIQDQ